jgi:2-iminobutanoate/2-iminopropanoate deaminase
MNGFLFANNDKKHNSKTMKKVIATTNAPAAIGPYSQAIEANGLIFVSGQLPINPATGEFPSECIKEQTEQAFKNIRAILTEAGLTLNNVVKTTVLLADIADFAGMNEIYAAQFEGTFPARSAFAVKSLPKNARIEIEVIAAR